MKSLNFFVMKAAEDCRQAKPAPNERVSKSRERRGVRQSPAAFPSRSEDGLTLIEVLVVVAILFVLCGLLLPLTTARYDGKTYPRLRCVSNLKQVGLAFRVYAGDNADYFPMQRLTNKFGAPLYNNSADLFRYFQVMSNELSNPTVLICPDDKSRRAATNFTTDFNSSHISYFLGLNADEIHSSAFLCGDTNIENGLADKNGLWGLTTNQNIAWTSERHYGAGNIALADGSVMQFSTLELQTALQKTGLTTNLLLMPDKNSVK